MGKPVEFITHDTKPDGTPCGSSRLQVFVQEDGSYDGYCFSCGTPVADPYKNKPKDYKPKAKVKTDEEIAAEVEEIKSFSCTDLPERKLKLYALDHFGVKIGFSTEDGVTPDSYYFPVKEGDNITGWRAGAFRLNARGKKIMWSVGDVKKKDLFGLDKAIEAGSDTLFITEGQFDAIALYQIIMREQFNTAYKDNVPSIVSINNGAGNALADIQNNSDKIKRHFKRVVLVFDQDTAGKDAADVILKHYPTWQVADLPCKDANECLKKGHVKAAFRAVKFNAKTPKNTNLIWGVDLIEDARKEAEWGLSWPWGRLTDLTRGIRFGETIYIGAGVKMGKSEILNAIASHMMLEHGLKVFMAKPEEQNAKTFKLLVGKAAGRIFHDPKIPFDHAAYDKWAPVIGNKVCMVNLYQHLGWETLKTDISVAAASGCKAAFIDPVTNLTAGMEAAAANTMLGQIAVDLAAMAKDLDIVIFIFCHLKSPENGLPHEMGGKIFSSQFAGSRSMMRSCNYMLGVEGNKSEDLPLSERNKRYLRLLEDREFGNVGSTTVFWDEHTGIFSEV